MGRAVTATIAGTDAQVHPTAVVEEGAVLGAGSQVWHFSHSGFSKRQVISVTSAPSLEAAREAYTELRTGKLTPTIDLMDGAIADPAPASHPTEY